MTDYNDGNWHGWNGGECPVHPESLVNVVWADDRNPPTPTVHKAGLIGWASMVGDAPAAFRVTKPYREPKTIWVNEYGRGFSWSAHQTEQEAKDGAAHYSTRIAVKYVEVPE